MSTSVIPTDLEAALRERGPGAYLITVGDAGAPHVVQAEVTAHPEGLIAEVGPRSAANARARGHVSVLYAARHADDYSLIVDAVATPDTSGDGGRLRLAPTRAVLHRPGPAAAPSGGSCGSDCIPISLQVACEGTAIVIELSRFRRREATQLMRGVLQGLASAGHTDR